MKTDSSMTTRSAASRTAGSGWTLLSSQIGPKASSMAIDIASQASNTASAESPSSGSASIAATRSRASASARAAVPLNSSAL